MYWPRRSDDQWRGEFFFEEEAVHRMSRKQRVTWRRRRIGMVFQSYHLLDDSERCGEHRSSALLQRHSSCRAAGAGGRYARQIQYCRQEGLVPKPTIGRPTAVGRHRARRHSQARALLLADEPTGNLHSAQAKEIMELFKTLNDEGTTIVQVTHSEENAKYGSRIIELRDGWLYSDTAGIAQGAAAGAQS